MISPEEICDTVSICTDAFEENHCNNSALMNKITIAADVFVAVNQSTLGYCAIYTNDYQSKQAYITLIAVRPEFQHIGVGKQLLKTVLEYCRVKGLHAIGLEVNKTNNKAISFYEKNGFCIVGDKSEKSFLMNRGV